MKDVTFEELKQFAEGKGAAKVVSLYLTSPHYNSEFIKEIVDELEKQTIIIKIAKAIGDEDTTYSPCQKMVFQILSENLR